MVSFLFFSGSKNEVAALQLSYHLYSNNRSAGKFNVGRVKLDGTSKI